MGTVELALRAAAERLTLGFSLPAVISPLATIPAARLVIYHADMQLRAERGEPGHELGRGLAEIIGEGDLGEALTEAIVAAEALDL